MSTYLSPKDLLDAFMTALRSWTGEPLAGAVFRKGPQRSLRIVSQDTLPARVCIVELSSIAAEESAGSGNFWWQHPTLSVKLAVADSDEDPETAENTRLDLIEEFGKFIHANRDLFGGAMVGHITNIECQIFGIPADVQRVFRGATVTVQYRTRRSNN